MSLRSKLWLVLGALFLVPLVVGVLVLALAVPQVKDDQLRSSLATDQAVVVDELTSQCRGLGQTARLVGFESSASTPTEATAMAVDTGSASYAALLRADGSVIAQAGTPPVQGVAPLALPSCSKGGKASGAVTERVAVAGLPTAAFAVAARRLDSAYLRNLQTSDRLSGQVVLLDGRSVIASTADASTTRKIADAVDGKSGIVTVGGWIARVGPPTTQVPYRVVVTTASGSTSSTTGLFVLILLAGAVVAGVLVTFVARRLTQPMADLAAYAERVARGDLDASIAESEDAEVRRVSEAFKVVQTDLRSNENELEQSRADLRESLERIGKTLTSTHDLDGLLPVVLDAAVVVLHARAGVVLYGGPDQLEVAAVTGLTEAGLVAPVGVAAGRGVLGQVIASGEGVRGTLGSGPTDLHPIDTEPGTGEIVAVPLRSMGNVVGAIALYGRVDGRAFDHDDEDALGTLASQASTAIDNVQLHQEAQRLSTTDALTGLWNFRYLSMSLGREIERSTRFERPLAVLMLDLDHFKQVNDSHGHARGDAVLRELAQRVQEQIREVDTFARYGGEEFVVVLPETTMDGATQLADRICHAVSREPFVTEGEDPLDVTVSVGVAAFPDHGSSAATLMRSADKALYIAKNGGRNRWQVPTS
ncbi:MAG: hypothetical protein QOH80_1686 [Actinomycetota bacterium]|nr:hypothetical protein [Actinomycetota bacterium]